MIEVVVFGWVFACVVCIYAYLKPKQKDGL